MNMVELIERETEKTEKHGLEYQGILVTGVPAQPTMQQVDALLRLIVQIAQRAKGEGVEDA